MRGDIYEVCPLLSTPLSLPTATKTHTHTSYTYSISDNSSVSVSMETSSRKFKNKWNRSSRSERMHSAAIYINSTCWPTQNNPTSEISSQADGKKINWRYSLWTTYLYLFMVWLSFFVFSLLSMRMREIIIIGMCTLASFAITHPYTQFLSLFLHRKLCFFIRRFSLFCCFGRLSIDLACFPWRFPLFGAQTTKSLAWRKGNGEKIVLKCAFSTNTLFTLFCFVDEKNSIYFALFSIFHCCCCRACIVLNDWLLSGLFSIFLLLAKKHQIHMGCMLNFCIEIHLQNE